MEKLKPNVILIQDKDDFREALQEALIDEGFFVEAFESPWEAVEALEKHVGVEPSEIGLVVSDLYEPSYWSRNPHEPLVLPKRPATRLEGVDEIVAVAADRAAGSLKALKRMTNAKMMLLSRISESDIRESAFGLTLTDALVDIDVHHADFIHWEGVSLPNDAAIRDFAGRAAEELGRLRRSHVDIVIVDDIPTVRTAIRREIEGTRRRIYEYSYIWEAIEDPDGPLSGPYGNPIVVVDLFSEEYWRRRPTPTGSRRRDDLDSGSPGAMALAAYDMVESFLKPLLPWTSVIVYSHVPVWLDQVSPESGTGEGLADRVRRAVRDAGAELIEKSRRDQTAWRDEMAQIRQRINSLVRDRLIANGE